MGYLRSDRCEGYNELQHGESPDDFIFNDLNLLNDMEILIIL